MNIDCWRDGHRSGREPKAWMPSHTQHRIARRQPPRMKGGAQNQARGRCRQPLGPAAERPGEHQHLSSVHSGSLQNFRPNARRCRWGCFGKDFGLKTGLQSLDNAPEICIASKLGLEESPIVGIEEVQNIQTGLLLGGYHRPVGGIIHGDFGVGGAGKASLAGFGP